MRTLSRRSLLAGLLASAGCEAGGSSRPTTVTLAAPPPPSAAPSAAAPEAGPDPALIARLADLAVYHAHFPRRALYTWTTAAQVEALRRQPVLLTRTESPSHGKAFFDVRREGSPYAMARIFGEPALARRRFAWPLPWATILGGDADPYGDRLVRVELKPEAIVARFGVSVAGDPTSGHDLAFFELDGRPVPDKEVIREAHRVAGVYHVYADPENLGGAFREFVLCNESMIAEWSIDTDEIRAEVAAGIDTVRRLRAEILARPPTSFGQHESVDAWIRSRGAPVLPALWAASLAFANARYHLDPAALTAIESALVALPRGEPLRHRPEIAFPGFEANPLAPPAGLPTTRVPGHTRPRKCVPMGTFGCQPLGGS